MKDLKVYTSGGSHGLLRDLLILSILFGIPFLLFLGGTPLIDPDEGRYAEIPREMLQRGDLITPTLNYVKYFEKPPLLYWINAASLKLFGLNEFAARLPSALCGLMTVLTTYIFARRLYDRRTALLSALILGTSAGFVIQSRIILTDMLLTFCLTAALGAFIVAAQRDGRRGSVLPWYLFYLFCALAVLAKGLIGIVFPGGIIFFYLLATNRWHLLKRMRLASGTLLFLAVAAPWFVAVSLVNPEFARFFFIHEHFERFTSTVHGRHQPFWFFIPVMLGTMLPWSFFIPGSIARVWRERRLNNGDTGIYLLIWVLLIFLFFSKSSSKLVPYMLPIFPPLAVMIGHRISSAVESHRRDLKLLSIMLGSVLSILGLAAIGYSRLPQLAATVIEFLPKLTDPVNQFVKHAPQISTIACLTIGGLFLLQGIVVLFSFGRNPVPMLVVLCIGSFMVETVAPQLVMSRIAQSESPRELSLKAVSVSKPDTQLVTFGPMQAVTWYTGRRVMVTGKIDELEFGSKQGDHSAWFPDRQAFLGLWKSNQHLLVFLKNNEFNDLRPSLQPEAKVISKTGRHLLISNR